MNTRKLSSKWRSLKSLTTNKLKITVRYGNTHKLVPNAKQSKSNKKVKNKHHWVVFVKVIHDTVKDSDLFEKITFELDETFPKPIYTKTKSPFQVSMKGWGTLEIPIKITWKENLKMFPIEFEHMLSFDGEGEWRDYTIRLNKDDIYGKKK